MESLEPYEHEAIRKDGTVVTVEGRGRMGVRGEDFFRWPVRRLASALNVKYAFVGELQGPENAHIRAHRQCVSAYNTVLTPTA